MKNCSLYSAISCVALLIAVPSSAQVAGREANPAALELGQCLVGQTTGNDRLLMARWIGISLSSSPQLADSVTVDADEKLSVDKGMAALYVRLLTRDCVEQVGPLVVAGDQRAIETGFGMLGEIAMRELMSNPQAQAAMMGFTSHIPPEAYSTVDTK